MIFKGEPNLFVRISNKYVQRATGIKGFNFDNNGEYKTDNNILIKLLSQHFETKGLKCSKCNQEFENRGLLLAHYREHKKEE
jgi:hypothetical protein